MNKYDLLKHGLEMSLQFTDTKEEDRELSKLMLEAIEIAEAVEENNYLKQIHDLNNALLEKQKRIEKLEDVAEKYNDCQNWVDWYRESLCKNAPKVDVIDQLNDFKKTIMFFYNHSEQLRQKEEKYYELQNRVLELEHYLRVDNVSHLKRIEELEQKNEILHATLKKVNKRCKERFNRINELEQKNKVLVDGAREIIELSNMEMYDNNLVGFCSDTVKAKDFQIEKLTKIKAMLELVEVIKDE